MVKRIGVAIAVLAAVAAFVLTVPFGPRPPVAVIIIEDPTSVDVYVQNDGTKPLSATLLVSGLTRSDEMSRFLGLPQEIYKKTAEVQPSEASRLNFISYRDRKWGSDSGRRGMGWVFHLMNSDGELARESGLPLWLPVVATPTS
jgi:hypothetical protein